MTRGLGGFFAVDPLAPKYPHNSPYAFSENRVLDGVELEGLEHQGTTVTYTYNNPAPEVPVGEIMSVPTENYYSPIGIMIPRGTTITDDNRLDYFGFGMSNVSTYDLNVGVQRHYAAYDRAVQNNESYSWQKFTYGNKLANYNRGVRTWESETRANHNIALFNASWFGAGWNVSGYVGMAITGYGAVYGLYKGVSATASLYGWYRAGGLTNYAVNSMRSNGLFGSGYTIIGEGMFRVSSMASLYMNSTILNNMPTFIGANYQITSQMMSYNRAWLLQRFRTGQPILDLGLDPIRKTPSIFYQMEQNMLQNYQRLHPGTLNVIKP